MNLFLIESHSSDQPQPAGSESMLSSFQERLHVNHCYQSRFEHLILSSEIFVGIGYQRVSECDCPTCLSDTPQRGQRQFKRCLSCRRQEQLSLGPQLPFFPSGWISGNGCVVSNAYSNCQKLVQHIVHDFHVTRIESRRSRVIVHVSHLTLTYPRTEKYVK